MNSTHWVRNPGKVHEALMELPDGSVTTKRDVKIYIPQRFVEKQLAAIGAETYIVGIFVMVVDDKFYAVSTVNAMMRIQPSTISTVKFDGDSYLEFYFAPGSVVIANTLLLKADALVYKIFNEIIAKGHVPWYVNYEDLAKLFDTADTHAGVNLMGSHAILEMFAAAIARDPNDRSKYYRHAIQQQSDVETSPPKMIALNSVTYGATNTTAKLLGSYWDDGLTSALVNPSQKTEQIEELLRR